MEHLSTFTNVDPTTGTLSTGLFERQSSPEEDLIMGIRAGEEDRGKLVYSNIIITALIFIVIVALIDIVRSLINYYMFGQDDPVEKENLRKSLVASTVFFFFVFFFTAAIIMMLKS